MTGGARKGAGRPKKGRVANVMVRIKPEMVERLSAHAKATSLSRADIIEDLVSTLPQYPKGKNKCHTPSNSPCQDSQS